MNHRDDTVCARCGTLPGARGAEQDGARVAARHATDRLRVAIGLGLRAVVLLAALTALGCAVTTIDVDVYKGPLANEHDVQMQQAAVMAIGAKPLLKQFRDVRELAKLSTPSASNTETRGAVDRYNALVKKAQNHVQHDFKDLAAGRANEVVSLYADRVEDPEVLALIERGKRAVLDYQVARQVLRPTFDRNMRLGLADRLQISDGLPKPAPLAPSSVDDARQAVRLALGEMLIPLREGESANDIQQYEVVIFDNLRNQQSGFVRAQPRLSADVQKTTTDGRFEALGREAFAQAVVDFSFQGTPAAAPDAAPARAELAREVVAISRSFTMARQALAEALDVVLGLIVKVNTDTDIPDEVRLDLSRRLREFAVGLMQEGAIKKSLKSARAQTLDWRAAADSEASKSGPERSTLSYVNQLLQSNPAKTAIELRALHEDLRRTPNTDRPHGLARGPTVEEAEIEAANTDDVVGLIRDVVSSLWGSFARGRPDRGLESMIDEFIRVSNSTDSSAEQVENVRRPLLDALVQFAQKILFLANNTILLDPLSEPSGSTRSASERQRDETEGRLFQAVGNAILVQVNELRARASWEKSGGSSPAIPAEANTTPTEGEPPSSVLDRLIDVYESKYREALNGTDKDKIANALKALDSAKAQRQRLVYIRPPSFYVKNSFPVTSLQGESSQGDWQNMVGQHGVRSMPFAELLVNDNSKAGKERRKMQQEIDKQYWQRINRVRVAGAGATNYVMVKDPIGNWYVKNYGADPKPIIDAAKNMAMFAAGGAINVPAAGAVAPAVPAAPGGAGGEGGTGGAAAGVTPGAPPPAPVSRGAGTVVDRQRENLFAKYTQRTLGDAEEIRELFTTPNPNDGTSATWGATSIGDMLSKAIAADDRAKHLAIGNKKLETAVGDDPLATLVSNATLGDLKALNAVTIGQGKETILADALGAVYRYRESVRAMIFAAKVNEPPVGAIPTSDDARAAALSILDRTVTAPLGRLIERRLATLDWYRSTLGALGESLKP